VGAVPEYPAHRILRDLRQANTSKMMSEQSNDLQECITCFNHHLHTCATHSIMQNSGPTTVVLFGMRWTPKDAQTILSLRALVLTERRWHRWYQFWQKINQYGVKHQ
jgi:hypothetical protein